MTYLGKLLVEEGRMEGRLEGRLEGQKNTERERLRADKAEAKVLKIGAEIQELKKKYGLA